MVNNAEIKIPRNLNEHILERCDNRKRTDKRVNEAEKSKLKRNVIGAYEKKQDKLINQLEDDRDILWTKVYDELSDDLIDDGKDVKREIKVRKGGRYSQVFPGNEDYSIIVLAKSPDEFDFAREVANHYGVRIGEPKKNTSSVTGSYYPYTVEIFI